MLSDLVNIGILQEYRERYRKLRRKLWTTKKSTFFSEKRKRRRFSYEGIASISYHRINSFTIDHAKYRKDRVTLYKYAFTVIIHSFKWFFFMFLAIFSIFENFGTLSRMEDLSERLSTNEHSCLATPRYHFLYF